MNTSDQDAIDIKPLLAGLMSGSTLSSDEAYQAFECVMSGSATEAQIASLLTAIASRNGGATTDEITGAARAMRHHVTPVQVPEGLEVIDTCGTGGDHSGTFNISTTAALIAAGAGAYVAKHGNRSVTSTSGSSQVLAALGVNLDTPAERLPKCLAEANICFCFAARHHPAMKYAVPVRQQLGFRTIFNMLGPLTNPAGASRQVVGVWADDLTEPLAQVLGNLGANHAMVVHGQAETDEGTLALDEISTAGPTRITTVKSSGPVETVNITPEDFGIARIDLRVLRVDSAEASAEIIRRVIDGESGPARDIAALNAAAALFVADIASDLADGLEKAQQAIDSGAAKTSLQKLIELTN